MAERPTDLDAAGEPADETTRLQREIVELRHRAGATLGELGRRVHELFDWRAQLRKHRVAVGLLVGAIALYAGARIGFVLWRDHRRRRLR